MKKSVLFIIGLLVLTGCGSKTESTASKTNDSLEKTISSLKQENNELNEKIEKYQALFEDFGDKNTETTGSENKGERATTMIYELNQEASLTDGSKETVKLKAVKASTNQADFPDHMISLESFDTSKMVSVTFEYTNVAYGEAFLPHAQYFQAFSKDGKSLEQVSQQDGQDKVTEGRTGTTRLFWMLPVDGSQFDELEIDFVPGNEKVATFKLPVSH